LCHFSFSFLFGIRLFVCDDPEQATARRRVSSADCYCSVWSFGSS
jgi:hypothetical protein